MREFTPLDPVTSKISVAQGAGLNLDAVTLENRAGLGVTHYPVQPFPGGATHLVTVRPAGTGNRAHVVEVNLTDPGTGRSGPAIRAPRYR